MARIGNKRSLTLSRLRLLNFRIDGSRLMSLDRTAVDSSCSPSRKGLRGLISSSVGRKIIFHSIGNKCVRCRLPSTVRLGDCHVYAKAGKGTPHD